MVVPPVRAAPSRRDCSLLLLLFSTKTITYAADAETPTSPLFFFVVPERGDQGRCDLCAALWTRRVPLQPVSHAVGVKQVAAGKRHDLF